MDAAAKSRRDRPPRHVADTSSLTAGQRPPTPPSAAREQPALGPSPSREAALVASIASLQDRAQRRMQQMQTIRSDTRATVDRLQRAQRTLDAIMAAPLRFHLPAGPTSLEGPPAAPPVRSLSPRPRNSR